MGVPIRRAVAEDRDALVDLLHRAFMSDPVSSWVFPDAARREANHPALMAAFLDASLEGGYVDVADDFSAVALWQSVPSGGHSGAEAGGDPDAGADEGKHTERNGDGDGPEDGPAALRAAIDPDNERVEQIARITGDLHPADRPHEYLLLIGVEPDLHGRGVGSDLLNHALGRCDREGLHAYLEASSARSRGLYERLGFTFMGRAIELPEGPSMWPMWREPRS